jgi:hypothetical protein
LGYLLCIHLKFSESKCPTCLEIGLFLLCIYYSPWKHTSIFIYSSWQLSMAHFPLAICDFQTTFLKTRIKATEVSILVTSAGHLKYWRYSKTREFRVKRVECTLLQFTKPGANPRRIGDRLVWVVRSSDLTHWATGPLIDWSLTLTCISQGKVSIIYKMINYTYWIRFEIWDDFSNFSYSLNVVTTHIDWMKW